MLNAFTRYTHIHIVSAHRRILGLASVVCVLVKIRVSSISLYKLDTDKLTAPLASVVCVLVKIRVSSISLYKLDTDKLTAPFESAHQFTLVCTVSDSKTVPGCHYNLCSNHSFVLTDYLLPNVVQSGFLTPWTLSAFAVH